MPLSEIERFTPDGFTGIGVPVNESLKRERVAMRDEPALDGRFVFEN